MGDSLKSSVVVVNEFTTKNTGSSGGGTRGGTPGQYVLGYMARSDAVEPIAPVARADLDSFMTKYMVRADAVEAVVAEHRLGSITSVGGAATAGYTGADLVTRRADRSARRMASRARVGSYTRARELPARELASELSRTVGDGGVAFGHNGVSLSHERLHADSREIQALFDNDHTVLKTVLSFDHEYLARNGIIPDEEVERGADGKAVAGAYRGKVDQLKLRMAVQDGLGRLARSGRFDDLRYVGVIQVDTGNVHVHLAMVDAGRGILAGNGAQKGMLTEGDMATLRRGLDMSLELTSHVRHLSASVGLERRNVSSWVKKWAYESLSVSSQAQFVMACLPQDRRLWRAGTNSKEMAKPNRLVRALVESQLSERGSPMDGAMAGVREYADDRAQREGLSQAQRTDLLVTGRERIITAACNGVYSVLLGVADDELSVSTSMMDMMSRDLESLVEKVAADDSIDAGVDSSVSNMSAGRFALRLRSYTERLDRHQRRRSEYLLAARRWEDSRDRGDVAAGSEAMYRHYVTEAEYHSRALAKYQYYLDMNSQVSGSWSKDWAAVEDYGRRLAGMRSLRADKSLPKMKDSVAAETLGQEIYGQPGGGLLAATGAQGKAGRATLDGRIDRAGVRYSQMVDDLLESWRQCGAGIRVRAGSPGMDVEPGELLISTGDRSLGGDRLGQPGAAVAVAASPEYDFDEVKGVDMHELSLDWASEQQVGQLCAQRYASLTARRESALAEATEWMILTDQDELIESELGQAQREVDRAGALAVSVTATHRLPSLIAQAAQRSEAARLELATLNEQATAGMEAATLARVMSDGDEDLEQWLLVQLAERTPKALGRTLRVDTGIGGAVHAGVDASVRHAALSPAG